MDMTEPVRLTDDELRAWSWRRELVLQERSIAWLARHTGRSESAVYKFAQGRLTPSLQWLREAWAVLGQVVPQ
jgi:hypothetical protein